VGIKGFRLWAGREGREKEKQLWCGGKGADTENDYDWLLASPLQSLSLHSGRNGNVTLYRTAKGNGKTRAYASL